MTAASLILIQQAFISIAEFATPVQINTVDDIPDCKLTVIDTLTGARQFRFFAIRLDQADTARYDSTAVLRLAFAELVHLVLGDDGRWDIEGLSSDDRTLLRMTEYNSRQATLLKSHLVRDLTLAMSPAVPTRLTLNRAGISVLASGHFRRSVDLKIATYDHDHHPRVSTNNSSNLNRQARSFDWPVRLHGQPAVMYLTHYRDMTPTGGYSVDHQALGADIVQRFNALFPFIKEPLELVDGKALAQQLDVALNQVEPKPDPDVRGAIRYGVYRHIDPLNDTWPFVEWPAYQFAEVWEDHPLVKKFSASFHTDQILMFNTTSLSEDLRLPDGYYSLRTEATKGELKAAKVEDVVRDFLSISNCLPPISVTYYPHDKGAGYRQYSMSYIMADSSSHPHESSVIHAALSKETVVLADKRQGQLSINGLALL